MWKTRVPGYWVHPIPFSNAAAWNAPEVPRNTVLRRRRGGCGRGISYVFLTPFDSVSQYGARNLPRLTSCSCSRGSVSATRCRSECDTFLWPRLLGRAPANHVSTIFIKRPRSKALCNISPRAPCLPPPQCCAPAKPLRSHAHASWPSPRPCQWQCPRPSHTGSCSRAAATAVVRPAPPGSIHPSHYPRSINRSSRAAVALCVSAARPRTASHQFVTW